MGFIAALSLEGSTAGTRANESAITVHKDPSCGCCSDWVQHLRDEGFKVHVEETSDLETIRTQLGVPPELAACHAAEAGGYILEGHVPATAVRRMLSEQPKIRGLAVPGMPVGSPGMEGGRASALYRDVVRCRRLKHFHALSSLKGDRLIRFGEEVQSSLGDNPQLPRKDRRGASRAVLAMMGDGRFLFGAEPWSIDVLQFGTLSIVWINVDRNAYPNVFAFAASPSQAC
jgi:hypothetical protein